MPRPLPDISLLSNMHSVQDPQMPGQKYPSPKHPADEREAADGQSGSHDAQQFVPQSKPFPHTNSNGFSQRDAHKNWSSHQPSNPQGRFAGRDRFDRGRGNFRDQNKEQRFKPRDFRPRDHGEKGRQQGDKFGQRDAFHNAHNRGKEVHGMHGREAEQKPTREAASCNDVENKKILSLLKRVKDHEDGLAEERPSFDKSRTSQSQSSQNNKKQSRSSSKSRSRSRSISKAKRGRRSPEKTNSSQKRIELLNKKYQILFSKNREEVENEYNEELHHDMSPKTPNDQADQCSDGSDF